MHDSEVIGPLSMDLSCCMVCWLASCCFNWDILRFKMFNIVQLISDISVPFSSPRDPRDPHFAASSHRRQQISIVSALASLGVACNAWIYDLGPVIPAIRSNWQMHHVTMRHCRWNSMKQVVKQIHFKLKHKFQNHFKIVNCESIFKWFWPISPEDITITISKTS